MFYYIKEFLKDFFIKEEHPHHVVFGGEYYVNKTLKTGNIALLISIIILIIIILH